MQPDWQKWEYPFVLLLTIGCTCRTTLRVCAALAAREGLDEQQAL